jgi:type I restriction enzyme, S subunit
VKAGWRTVPIAEVGSVFDGPHATPKTVDEGPLFLGIGALVDGTVNLGETRHVTASDFRRWTRRVRPQTDDIVFSYETRLGQAAIIPEGLECCLGRRMGLVRLNKDHVVPQFFLYQYISPPFREFLDSKTVRGATVDRISIRDFPSFPIALPPLPEQRRIVGILDEAFEGVATAKANAEKNLQNARALFESHLQSVFTRRENEVGLSELASDITDGDHMPPPKAPSGVPFITISDIVKNTREIDFSNTFTVPMEYFRGLKPNKKPRIGDVLYTVTGATLGIPVLVREQRDFCFQRHIGLVRPKPDTDSTWLSYALLSPQVFRQATLGSTGAAQKTVSLSVLRGLKVPKMALTEQKRIAAQLDTVFAETQQLASIYQQKLAALDELKKSLLHQAFSGQL